MYYIINDVETSGRHRWWHDIVSCALVVLDDELNIIDKFYEECCPWYLKNFDEETVAIHGLTIPYLKRQQSSYQMCVNILHFLDKYREKDRIVYRPFVYHALNRFDFLFMENMFLKNSLEFSFRKMFNWQHSFSTIRMARQFGYADNGLSVWAPRLGERFTHHKAIEDAIIAAKVFIYLIRKGATLESGLEIKKSDIEVVEVEKPKRKYKTENEDICNSSLLSFSLA